MNCADFESVLADHLDGTLSPAEAAAINEHAAGCSDCREFMSDVTGGLAYLGRAVPLEPPAELITRIAYLAPAGRTRQPFERETPWGRLFGKWLAPLLQPRLAMGMAMTVLSFAMLERCTGLHVQHLQPADLNPLRVWSGIENKALRVKDQAVKYYENLRIVYEIETHLKDLQEQQDSVKRAPARASASPVPAGPSTSSPKHQEDKP